MGEKDIYHLSGMVFSSGGIPSYSDGIVAAESLEVAKEKYRETHSKEENQVTNISSRKLKAHAENLPLGIRLEILAEIIPLIE